MNEMTNGDVKTFDFKLAIDAIQVPMVATIGKNKGMCFLIDTGATNCILCDYVYEALKDQITDSEEQRVHYGIEGQKKIVNTASMTLNFNNQDYDVDFNIADLSGAFDDIEKKHGFQIHGILGVDFLLKYKWTIDFGNCILTMPVRTA